MSAKPASPAEAAALLARVAPLAEQVRRTIADVNALCSELVTQGGEVQTLGREVLNAVEYLGAALVYLTPQHDFESCTIAALERRVANTQVQA